MKILVVSDTHRKHTNLSTVIEREAPFEQMLHLGDAEGCEDEIQVMAGCPLEIVAGNSDFFSVLPREKEIEIAGYRIFLTHGHYYDVTSGIEDIKKEAIARKCDIVAFGHTHVPLIEYGDEVIAINPGSLSHPRQEGRQPSYLVIEIDKKGKAHFEIRYLSKV